MAQADTIKEFLVGLGYKVDSASQRTMLDSVENMTKNVLKLGAAIEATAALVVDRLARMASAMEDLYYVSRRTGSAADSIQAFGYAASQMGSSVEAARGSLEGFGRALRGAPGLVGALSRLGVETKGANGGLRDTADILTDLGKRLSSMPMPVALAYANMFGIDEKTLFALMDGIGEFSAEYHRMLKLAGMDSQEATKRAHGFMVELRSLGAAFDILKQKAAAQLFGAVGEDLRRLRDYLLVNSAQITHVIEVVAKGAILAAEVFTRLALRVGEAVHIIIGYFDSLPPHSQHLIEEFAGIIAAWKLVNSAFLRSPIGIIVALAGAILALWDDYKTWKEGGKSLIDWGKWEPQIRQAILDIKQLAHWLDMAAQAVGGWQNALGLLATFLAEEWIRKVVSSFAKAGAAAAGFRTSLIGILGLLGIAGYLAYTLWPNSAGDKQSDRDAAGLPAAGIKLPEATPHNNTMGNWIRRQFGVTEHDESGNANRIYETAIEQGLTPAQASALVASAQRESSFNPTDTTGDGGHAQGLWQWHADRVANFVKMFGHEPAAGTVREQTIFAIEELRHPEKYGQPTGPGQDFFNATTPEQAADAQVSNLRPGDPADARGQDRKRAFDWYNRFIHPEQHDAIYLRDHPSSGSPDIGITPNIADPGLMHQYDQSKSVTINQNNNTTITGVSDPHKAADHATDAHKSANGQLVRNFRDNVR